MNDYAAAPYLLVSDLLPIVIGMVFLIVTIVRTRKEARRYSNAVFLGAAVFFLIRGLTRFYTDNNWHEVRQSDGSFYITNESAVLDIIAVIFLTAFFILGIFLIVTGIRLIRKEGRTVTHALSLFFGIMSLSLPFAIFFLIEAGAQDRLPSYLTFFILEAFYVPFCCISYFLYSFVYLHLPRKKKPDYIVILGASLCGRKVSPLLAKRVDKAFDEWKMNGEKPVLIPSGGQGRDEEISEAAAMHNYLTEKGVPDEKIIEENKSVNTFQNMAFSKKIMEAHSEGKPYYSLFATNDFHVYRSAVYAHAAGLQADGIGCRTAGYYYPSAILREILAFILRYRKFAVLYTILAALYTLADIVSPGLTTYIW